MNIEWTACSDKMPPAANDLFIIRYDRNNKYLSVRSGFMYNAFARNLHIYDWTKFTQAKWDHLNEYETKR